MDVAIAPNARAQHIECPAIFSATSREIEGELVVTIVTHAVREVTALLSIGRFGHDVHRSTHRGSRHLRSTKTALCLDARGYVGKTSPVRPVNTTPLHVVHRNAIDEHSYVLTLKATHRDFGVTITTTFTRHIYARGRFEHLGEVGSTHFLFDHYRSESGERHRSFACHRASGHHSVLERHRGLVHRHKTEVTVACDVRAIEILCLIAYARELEILLCALGSFEEKLTIGISDCYRFSSLHHNGHACNRLVVLTVDHCALDHCRLRHCTHGSSYGYNGGE